jgi:hypothetical protein
MPILEGLEHGAWGYAVGGWRSAALEVGGRGQRSDVRDQKAEAGWLTRELGN